MHLLSFPVEGNLHLQTEEKSPALTQGLLLKAEGMFPPAPAEAILLLLSQAEARVSLIKRTQILLGLLPLMATARKGLIQAQTNCQVLRMLISPTLLGTLLSSLARKVPLQCQKIGKENILEDTHFTSQGKGLTPPAQAEGSAPRPVGKRPFSILLAWKEPLPVLL